MNILPVVKVVSVEEVAGVVSAPFKFKVPVPPDMSIIFVIAAEEVNEIPPFAFKTPEVMVIAAVFEVFVLDPGNEMSPATVAEPALILHLFSNPVPWVIVTVPFTVSSIPEL